MREVAFIKQNKNKWEEYEDILNNNTQKEPDYLISMFNKLNNDLAFAQTYYPKSHVVDYLNSLTSDCYHKVYKQKQDYFGILNFWKYEVPLIAYKQRKYIYFGIIFFIFCVFVGWLSSSYDENFTRSILGDEYVNMTMENIQNGDVTAVYNNESIFGDISSAFRITVNNLWVGLQAYAYGLISGIGTIYIVFKNGVMVGTFQHMFYQEGYLLESVRGIWIHGAMEIFGITIEAAAGLLLGLSWLFPGSLTRKQAFLVKGKESLKLVLSTFPWTISAGILEGFITQYANEMPIYLAFTIIILTFGWMIYYYLIYPYKIAKKQNFVIDETLREIIIEK